MTNTENSIIKVTTPTQGTNDRVLALLRKTAEFKGVDLDFLLKYQFKNDAIINDGGLKPDFIEFMKKFQINNGQLFIRAGKIEAEKYFSKIPDSAKFTQESKKPLLYGGNEKVFDKLTAVSNGKNLAQVYILLCFQGYRFTEQVISGDKLNDKFVELLSTLHDGRLTKEQDPAADGFFMTIAQYEKLFDNNQYKIFISDKPKRTIEAAANYYGGTGCYEGLAALKHGMDTIAYEVMQAKSKGWVPTDELIGDKDNNGIKNDAVDQMLVMQERYFALSSGNFDSSRHTEIKKLLDTAQTNAEKEISNKDNESTEAVTAGWIKVKKAETNIGALGYYTNSDSTFEVLNFEEKKEVLARYKIIMNKVDEKIVPTPEPTPPDTTVLEDCSEIIKGQKMDSHRKMFQGLQGSYWVANTTRVQIQNGSNKNIADVYNCDHDAAEKVLRVFIAKDGKYNFPHIVFEKNGKLEIRVYKNDGKKGEISKLYEAEKDKNQVIVLKKNK